MSAIANKLAPAKQTFDSFIDRHFATIAFTVSTLALSIFGPFGTLLGTTLGFALNRLLDPDLDTKGPENKVVKLTNTLFTIMGALAALVRCTPTGACASLGFKILPILCSMAVGSTIYRASRSI